MKPYRLYGMASPNVVKVVIALEEMGLPYDFQRVDVILGEQRADWFLALNPNGRVPVLVEPRDGGDFALSESAAIMDYLAQKHGQFGGSTSDEQAVVRQWLYFQMAGIGPMFGQAIHFSFTKDCEYGRNRFANEMRRLLGVVDTHLSQSDYMAGDYSIADMAIWPWVRTLGTFFSDDVRKPVLTRWYEAIEARPAVRAATERMDTCAHEDGASMKSASKEQLDRYFGRVAPQRQG